LFKSTTCHTEKIAKGQLSAPEPLSSFSGMHLLTVVTKISSRVRKISKFCQKILTPLLKFGEKGDREGFKSFGLKTFDRKPFGQHSL
jgi:hypothetical protein